MTALTDLPLLAEQADWLLDERAPDFFGDVRISLLSAAGETILLVFKRDGKLAGGYLTERDGKMFRTEHARDVEVWLTSLNGGIE